MISPIAIEALSLSDNGITIELEPNTIKVTNDNDQRIKIEGPIEMPYDPNDLDDNIRKEFQETKTLNNLTFDEPDTIQFEKYIFNLSNPPSFTASNPYQTNYKDIVVYLNNEEPKHNEIPTNIYFKAGSNYGQYYITNSNAINSDMLITPTIITNQTNYLYDTVNEQSQDITNLDERVTILEEETRPIIEEFNERKILNNLIFNDRNITNSTYDITIDIDNPPTLGQDHKTSMENVTWSYDLTLPNPLNIYFTDGDLTGQYYYTPSSKAVTSNNQPTILTNQTNYLYETVNKSLESASHFKTITTDQPYLYNPTGYETLIRNNDKIFTMYWDITNLNFINSQPFTFVEYVYSTEWNLTYDEETKTFKGNNIVSNSKLNVSSLPNPERDYYTFFVLHNKGNLEFLNIFLEQKITDNDNYAEAVINLYASSRKFYAVDAQSHNLREINVTSNIHSTSRNIYEKIDRVDLKLDTDDSLTNAGWLRYVIELLEPGTNKPSTIEMEWELISPFANDIPELIIPPLDPNESLPTNPVPNKSLKSHGATVPYIQSFKWTFYQSIETITNRLTIGINQSYMPLLDDNPFPSIYDARYFNLIEPDLKKCNTIETDYNIHSNKVIWADNLLTMRRDVNIIGATVDIVSTDLANLTARLDAMQSTMDIYQKQSSYVTEFQKVMNIVSGVISIIETGLSIYAGIGKAINIGRNIITVIQNGIDQHNRALIEAGEMILEDLDDVINFDNNPKVLKQLKLTTSNISLSNESNSISLTPNSINFDNKNIVGINDSNDVDAVNDMTGFDPNNEHLPTTLAVKNMIELYGGGDSQLVLTDNIYTLKNQEAILNFYNEYLNINNLTLTNYNQIESLTSIIEINDGTAILKEFKEFSFNLEIYANAQDINLIFYPINAVFDNNRRWTKTWYKDGYYILFDERNNQSKFILTDKDYNKINLTQCAVIICDVNTIDRVDSVMPNESNKIGNNQLITALGVKNYVDNKLQDSSPIYYKPCFIAPYDDLSGYMIKDFDTNAIYKVTYSKDNVLHTYVGKISNNYTDIIFYDDIGLIFVLVVDFEQNIRIIKVEQQTHTQGEWRNVGYTYKDNKVTIFTNNTKLRFKCIIEDINTTVENRKNISSYYDNYVDLDLSQDQGVLYLTNNASVINIYNNNASTIELTNMEGLTYFECQEYITSYENSLSSISPEILQKIKYINPQIEDVNERVKYINPSITDINEKLKYFSST